MNCEQLVHYLSDYIDNTLDDALAAEARAHLSTCHNCRVVLDSTQRTILLYREQGQQQVIPPTRGRALYERLAQALARSPDSDQTG